MDTGIRVGHENSGKTVEDMAAGIATIFAAGHEAHADREVMIEAFRAFREGVSIHNVAISNCSVSAPTNNYSVEFEDVDD